MKFHRRRAGNGGYSLVELLIAIVILGLIVGPLLHTFVTASGTSARSRKIGDATLAAQNIAEAAEANGLSSLLANPKNVLGGSTSGFYTVGSDGVYTLSSSSAAAGKSKYTVGLTGLKAGKNTFDAVVSLDAQTDQAGSAFYAINSKQLADYANMDAIFAQSWEASEDPDQVSLADFKVHAASVCNDAGVVPSVKRTIQLTAGYAKNEDGSTDTGTLSATLVYSYEYTFSYVEETLDDNGAIVTNTVTDTWSDSKSYMLFPRGFTITNGVMPSIYLLYNPWYKGLSAYGGGSCSKVSPEKIIVTNTDDLPFTVFLVKQADPGITDTAVLMSKETAYSASIVLQQSNAVTANTVARIYSNAKENLAGGAAITGVTYKIMRGLYLHENGSFTGDLVSRSAKNRIYLVTISIYPSGTVSDGKAVGTVSSLCTFTTTKLE